MKLPLVSRDRYFVHSAFLTFQGEGLHAGKRAVFIRFSGCNVWNGVEKDRERDANRNSECALICDTEFKGQDPTKLGGVYTCAQLVALAIGLWGASSTESEPMVVFTGGEPTLQVDSELVRALRARNFYTAIETNGSNLVPKNISWVTISPKFPMELLQQSCDEVKLLSIFLDNPEYVEAARRLEATFRWVQPVDMTKKCLLQHPDADCAEAIRVANRHEMQKCLQFAMKTPGWRMGNQAHKFWGID